MDAGCHLPLPTADRCPESQVGVAVCRCGRSCRSAGIARLIDYQDEAHAHLVSRCAASLLRPSTPGILREDARLTRGRVERPRIVDVVRGYDSRRGLEDPSGPAAPGTRQRPCQARPARSCHRVHEAARRGDLRHAAGQPGSPRFSVRRPPFSWLGYDDRRPRDPYQHDQLATLLLRMIGGLRRWRRGTLRFHEEARARAARWLDQVARLYAGRKTMRSRSNWRRSQKLVRGYGDTYERGLRNFERLCQASDRLVGRPDAAAELSRRCVRWHWRTTAVRSWHSR